MSKITSFARQQTHGVSDPLSGATVAPSNDHTDGSWAITDIYDRELMINTGNGDLQYRAGSNIYTVQTSPTFGAIKSITKQIGAWDMSTAGATNGINIPLGIELSGKTFVGIDAMLYPDPGTVLETNGFQFKYDYTQGVHSSALGLNIIQNFAAPPFNTTSVSIGIDATPPVGTDNIFRWYSDSVDASFTDTGVNRGYIIVTYID